MYLKLKIPLKIFLFTISRFLLQFSSLLFLFFLIFFSETLFNSTQFLTNFSNLLSYPAIAISTLIVTMPIFFKSFFEFYNAIIENHKGYIIKLKFSEGVLGEVLKSYSDYKHLKKITNWTPKTSLKNGLKKTISWFEQNT